MAQIPGTWDMNETIGRENGGIQRKVYVVMTKGGYPSAEEQARHRKQGNTTRHCVCSALYTMLILFCGRFLTVAAKKEGMLIIPGLGRVDRLRTVAYNLQMLEKQYLSGGESSKWDCVVYTYAGRNNASDAFWSQEKELNYISSLCNIVENPGKRVTENLYMVQPQLLKQSYEYLFILLDDCVLVGDNGGGYFDLGRIVRVMKRNSLTVASPMVQGANTGGGQKFRTIMQAQPKPGTEGYVSVFVEIFAWVVTMPAYTALWELLYPFANPYGWGYDFWYNSYASDRVVGHKMGIVSTVKVRHEQGTSLADRTDNARVEDKWKGVMLQEKVYLTHFGVNLKKYRESLKLKNSSWNGAVTGYLYD